MKRCPQCSTLYSDHTLNFCLQDRARLEEADDEQPTVVSRSTASSEIPHQPTSPNELTPRRSSKLPVVLLTVAVMLLIFGALGLLGWSFIKKSLLETSQKNAEPQRPQNQAPNVNSQRANADSRSSPTPTRTGTPASIDAAEIRSEIADRIENWRSQSEAIDLDEYMKQYAETVDYYRKPGLSAAFVRADKDRAFSRYDSISIDISNISITPSADGSTATAELDKEWRFEGDGDASSGKVRQLLRFRKIKSQWLITAEKDLRTYYTR